MAITFSQQRRKQQYLTLAFIGIILVTLVVVWKGFMASSSAPPSVVESVEPVKPPEIEINFALLDKLASETSTQALVEFPKIPSLPEGTIVGRENPYIPYGPPDQSSGGTQSGTSSVPSMGQ